MDLKLVKGIPPGSVPTKEEEAKLDVNAIPDLEKLLNSVIEVLKYIDTDEMQELEARDQFAFERHLDEKFGDFSLKYYPIFMLLTDKKNREENVCKLIDMFSRLKKVKDGQVDITEADKSFNEDLNSEYIYPKFGGKEEYERKVLKKKPSKNGNAK